MVALGDHGKGAGVADLGISGSRYTLLINYCVGSTLLSSYVPRQTWSMVGSMAGKAIAWSAGISSESRK